MAHARREKLDARDRWTCFRHVYALLLVYLGLATLVLSLSAGLAVVMKTTQGWSLIQAAGASGLAVVVTVLSSHRRIRQVREHVQVLEGFREAWRTAEVGVVELDVLRAWRAPDPWGDACDDCFLVQLRSGGFRYLADIAFRRLSKRLPAGQFPSQLTLRIAGSEDPEVLRLIAGRQTLPLEGPLPIPAKDDQKFHEVADSGWDLRELQRAELPDCWKSDVS